MLKHKSVLRDPREIGGEQKKSKKPTTRNEKKGKNEKKRRQKNRREISGPRERAEELQQQRNEKAMRNEKFAFFLYFLEQRERKRGEWRTLQLDERIDQQSEAVHSPPPVRARLADFVGRCFAFNSLSLLVCSSSTRFPTDRLFGLDLELNSECVYGVVLLDNGKDGRQSTHSLSSKKGGSR